jgi:hypothetical protein
MLEARVKVKFECGFYMFEEFVKVKYGGGF